LVLARPIAATRFAAEHPARGRAARCERRRPGARRVGSGEAPRGGRTRRRWRHARVVARQRLLRPRGRI